MQPLSNMSAKRGREKWLIQDRVVSEFGASFAHGRVFDEAEMRSHDLDLSIAFQLLSLQVWGTP
jgi:hypothetical protein